MGRPRKKTEEETQEQVEETPVEEPEAEASRRPRSLRRGSFAEEA